MKHTTHTAMARYTQIRGFTLVELMIAMAISLVVLLAVGTVYFSTKRTYNIQSEYSRLQANALYAFQRVSQDISSAGYVGCNPNIYSQISLGGANSNFYDYKDAIYGWEYKGTSPGNSFTITTLAPAASGSNWVDDSGANLDSSLVGKVIPGTDVIVFKSAKQAGLQPSANIADNATSIQFAQPLLIAPGSLMLVSDCNKADLFINTAAIGGNTLDRGTTCPSGSTVCNKSGSKWSHAYNKDDTQVYLSTSEAYYIGRSATGNGEPALFRYAYNNSTSSSPEELVDGVENMQILYGVNNGAPTGVANSYVTIDKVTDLSKILAVRISLLLRTTGQVDRPAPAAPPAQDVGAIQATAVQVTPMSDRRLRKVFTTTIMLRNMSVQDRNQS